MEVAGWDRFPGDWAAFVQVYRASLKPQEAEVAVIKGIHHVAVVMPDFEGNDRIPDPCDRGYAHIALEVTDIDDEYQRLSDAGQWGPVMVEFVQQDEEGPSPFRDIYGALGHMIEIYEKAEQLTGFYGFIRSASKNWDQSDPVRRL